MQNIQLTNLNLKKIIRNNISQITFFNLLHFLPQKLVIPTKYSLHMCYLTTVLFVLPIRACPLSITYILLRNTKVIHGTVKISISTTCNYTNIAILFQAACEHYKKCNFLYFAKSCHFKNNKTWVYVLGETMLRSLYHFQHFVLLNI